MSDRFPNFLLEYLIAENIDLESLSTTGDGRIFPNGYMIIDSSCSPQQQELAVLHEVLHLHPNFVSYTGGLWQGTLDRDPATEAAIENLAKDIYDNDPEIVAEVRKTLDTVRSQTQNSRS